MRDFSGSRPSSLTWITGDSHWLSTILIVRLPPSSASSIRVSLEDSDLTSIPSR